MLKNTLKYQVWCTGAGMYRIGAIKDHSQPVHGGNMLFTPEIYDNREDADKALAAMQAQEGDKNA